MRPVSSEETESLSVTAAWTRRRLTEGASALSRREYLHSLHDRREGGPGPERALDDPEAVEEH